ncbi:hypothetical protein [Pantoea sp. ANP04]|uniref:hypothetical protein n=1 Tax=Pantoea sp. ANP04 TaxID=3064896 RepID=UPI0035C59BFB
MLNWLTFNLLLRGLHAARLSAPGVSGGSEISYLRLSSRVEPTVKGTYIANGTVGDDLKLRNERENEWFYQVVKSLISNAEPLRRLVTTVITEFYWKLDAQGKEAVRNQLAYGAGKIGGDQDLDYISSHPQTFQRISNEICKKAG